MYATGQSAVLLEDRARPFQGQIRPGSRSTTHSNKENPCDFRTDGRGGLPPMTQRLLQKEKK